MDKRDAWLALNLIPNLGSILARRLLDRFGFADKILLASESDLISVEGINPALAKRISCFDKGEALNREKALMTDKGVDFICLEDPEYPGPLRNIFDPPMVLYIKGRILPEDSISISIVGSRRPTLYGKSVAKTLSSKLAGRGLTIVSGMARGIDTMAHRGALKAGGRTIAVMGSGFGQIYPSENTLLMEEISKNGAVVSEFPMETPPFKQNFPLRNRIISGISLGTLVVEAGLRSGALITARLALEQDREVFAVPGPINSWASKGTNDLIKQGAKLVVDESDIFEELGPHAGGIFFKRPSEETERPMNKEADITESIIRILADGPIHIDILIEKTGISAQELIARLISLEMEGIIRQLPGKIYVKE